MPGRGEAIRLLLRHANVPFEDVRIKFEEWPKMKEQFELQQLPVLECHGKRLTQSYAILLYLGRLHGYMFTCPIAAQAILCAMNTFEDFMTKFYPGFTPMSPFSEAEKSVMQEDFLKNDFPFFMNYFESVLKQNKDQTFMFGNRYTVADFFILGSYKQLRLSEKMAKFMDSCTQFPLMKAYLEKRLADLEGTSKVPPTKPKLHYFDMHGRASMIRLLLKHAKVEYDEVRIKQQDWMSYKGKYPLKQVPVLEIDGKELCQTDAIMQFLALRHGYLSLKPEKYYRIIFLANTIKDLFNGFVGIAFSKLPEADKNKKFGEFFTDKAPLMLAAIEKRLKENRSQEFLVGRKYTMADFYMLGAAQWIIVNPMFPGVFDPIMKNYPILKSYIDKRLTDFK